MGVEAAHGGDFPKDSRFHSGGQGLRLVDGFDGNGGAVGKGGCVIDLGEAAPTEEAAELVLSEQGSSDFVGGSS